MDPEEAGQQPADDAGTVRRAPRDGLVRAQPGDFELRSVEGQSLPTMVGHFAVFNQWTEINSIFEGRFLERIAPGAFNRTIERDRAAMRVTFQHGKDPQLGDKVLGPIATLEEDDTGARYEVPLLETSYNRDLIPGLQAGLYGSSFRFSVMKEDFERSVKKSAYNPEALPERTVREAQVFEFGPVTYPAYGGASAGLRSITDQYIVEQLVAEPERLRELLTFVKPDIALPPIGLEAAPHSDQGTRDEAAAVLSTHKPRFTSREDFLEWIQRT